MSRRRGVVVGAIVVLLAIVLWKWKGSGETELPKGVGPVATKTTPAISTAARPRPDPATLVRGSIAGTITDEKLAPVVGARVCASGYSYDLADELLREPRCDETDARGAYTVTNLLPARYIVSAGAKTFRPAVFHPDGKRTKTRFPLAAGEHKSGVDLALRGGGVEITGVVSDVTGGPIANAHVRTHNRWGDGDGITTTESDEQGRFSLWVSPGRVDLGASAEGYSDGDASGRAPGKLEILLTPESSLSGIVVDAATNQPVAGARVLVGMSEWGWDDGETTLTDAQGAFRVARLTPGRHVAVARTERGYGRSEGSTLVGLSQHVDGVVVKLFPASRIDGTVVIAGTKTPCPEGSVSFRDTQSTNWIPTRPEADGTRVAEGVLPGTYTPQPACEGYSSSETYAPLTIESGKDATGLQWEVEPGATIRGKVLTKAGEPVEGARISARSIGGAARARNGYGGDRATRDGTYELTGLRAGEYQIEAESARGVAPKDGYKVTVDAGAVVTKDLVIDDSGTIVGTVVDAEGKPVGGVSISARSTTGGGRSYGSGGIKSDDAGTFTLEALRPGDYRVIASRGWSDQLRKPGTTDDAKQGEKVAVVANQTATVRLVVESQSGTITGTVVDTAGKPIADAFVSAARESDAAGSNKSTVQHTRWAIEDRPVITGTDGTFAVTKLSPGTYTIRAYRKGGGEAVAEHIALGGTAKLALSVTGSLAGLAKRDGAPPDEITVTLHDPISGFRRLEKFYRTAGQFTIRDVPKGHFRLSVDARGDQKQIELDLAEGETKTGIVVELEALVTLTGRVVELGTQKPVAGMQMMAALATTGSFRFDGNDARDNVSDESGRFKVANAPRGKVTLTGFPKDFQTSDFAMLQAVRQVDGSGTIDLGDVAVVRKRVKRGDPVGELGINFAQQPPDTQPDKRELVVSFIDPTGPAAKTALEIGDQLIAIDGIDITGANVAHAWTLLRAPPGTKLALGLQRGASVAIVLAAP